MTKEEIAYRLQAMATMCIFKDACGHDLSQEEIKKYNEAKNIAIDKIKALEAIVEEVKAIEKKRDYKLNNSDYWEGFYTVAEIIDKHLKGKKDA